jgi:hypothetical protein
MGGSSIVVNVGDVSGVVGSDDSGESKLVSEECPSRSFRKSAASKRSRKSMSIWRVVYSSVEANNC